MGKTLPLCHGEKRTRRNSVSPSRPSPAGTQFVAGRFTARPPPRSALPRRGGRRQTKRPARPKAYCDANCSQLSPFARGKETLLRQFVEQKKFGYWKQSCTHKQLSPPHATTSPSRTATKEARLEPQRVRQPGVLPSPLRHRRPADGEPPRGAPSFPLSPSCALPPARGRGAGWSGAAPAWGGLGAAGGAERPRRPVRTGAAALAMVLKAAGTRRGCPLDGAQPPGPARAQPG